MPIATVIIISLLLANLALTLIMFWIIHDLLEVTKSLQDSEGLCYDTICSAYKTMYDQYKLITDMQTKLLNCWEGCEERCSQSYEEFKHCSDKLKEVSFQLTDLANVSTEDEYTITLNEACDTVCLDCPYKKCQTEVCPVYEIKMQQKEIEAEWEEYDEAERWKASHEGDDTVELDE